MKNLVIILTSLVLSTLLIAQEASAPAAAATPAQPSFLSMMMPFAIIMFIFYFLMIRPQKKKMEQETKFLNALKKGDEVYTRSGLIGTIYGMADKIVTLEVSDGIKLKVLKSQIAGDAKALFAPEVVAPKKS
jgi:preprotein translocase subunit YajC